MAAATWIGCWQMWRLTLTGGRRWSCVRLPAGSDRQHHVQLQRTGLDRALPEGRGRRRRRARAQPLLPARHGRERHGTGLRTGQSAQHYSFSHLLRASGKREASFSWLRARPKAERVLLRIRKNPECLSGRPAGPPAVVTFLRGVYLWNRNPDWQAVFFGG